MIRGKLVTASRNEQVVCSNPLVGSRSEAKDHENRSWA